jgi:hypothetical protein
MSIGGVTLPSEYPTNTDETDALALDVSPELGQSESVASAVCELRDLYTRAAAPAAAFPSSATVATNVVTQRFDARELTPGRYEWIWNCTLNTGAVRSFKTVLLVEDHD